MSRRSRQAKASNDDARTNSTRRSPGRENPLSERWGVRPPPSPFRAYANRRAAALLFLGFASGLPLTLTSSTLDAWLTRSGLDLKAIGLSAFVTLPYLFKAAWAPFLDRCLPPLLGRRRGWLVVTQVAVALAIAVMALFDPSASLMALCVAAVAVAFASASQDIVADAYRADTLREDERGAGAAVFVTGYRVALIAVGAGVLFLVDAQHGPGLSWRAAYLAAAAFALVCVLATLFAPEPEDAGGRPDTLAESFVVPLRQFLGSRAGILALVFVALFKLPDAICAKMTTPFLLEAGVTEAQIGAIRQGIGILVSIAGALAGGLIVSRAGLHRSLFVFAVLQAASNLAFLAIVASGPDTGVLVAVIAVENFCGGLVTAGFVAFLMSRCDPRYSATQYALLTSVMALTNVIGGAVSGYLAAALGWPMFFAVSALAGAPGIALIPFVRTTNREAVS